LPLRSAFQRASKETALVPLTGNGVKILEKRKKKKRKKAKKALLMF
jgi:hypothetical protein